MQAIRHYRKHALQCCGGVGVILVLRLCTVVIVRDNRLSAYGSIFLDDHGEDDYRLARGKALYLSQSRLQELRALFLTNGVDHNTRLLDSTSISEW